ncbi:MAG: Gfo/Idh/MocA family protein [Magnetospirillum sp.]
MIAVLGLGSIGLRHAGNLVALGHQVIGFDPSPDRRALLAEKGGAVTDDRAHAIAQSRAVVVASPSEHHLDDLQACLKAGRHVLVEKPLAHRTDGLAAMMAQAERAGLVVAVAMMLRLHPAVRRAAEILKAGQLGKPLWGRFLAALYLPEWRPGQDWTQGYANDPKTGGALFDYVHEIDLACHLLGPATVQSCVATNTGTIGLTAEDMADVVLDHQGARSSLHVDYVTRPRHRYAEIAGTLGALRIDLDGRHLLWRDTSGDTIEDMAYPGSYADDYLAEMAAFVAAIDRSVPPPCSGAQALDVLETLISARTLAGLPS